MRSSKDETLKEVIALVPEHSTLRASDTFAEAALGKLNTRELLALKDALLLLGDKVYRKHVKRMTESGLR